MSARYVVMDFETTGINKYHDDEVVQVAIINQDDEILLHELCCPKHHFSWVDAQKVHGITPAMVKNKMPFEHYLEQIISIFEDYDFIVCYNIAFEKGNAKFDKTQFYSIIYKALFVLPLLQI